MVQVVEQEAPAQGRRRGRPPKDRTVEEVEVFDPRAVPLDEDMEQNLIKLGRVGAKERQVAAGLSMTVPEWRLWALEHPHAMVLLNHGAALGELDALRMQHALLLSGNPQAAIWAGKQRLGQSEKAEITMKADLTNFTDDELQTLLRLQQRAAASNPV